MKGRNIFIIFLVTVILGTSALASLILVDGTYPIDLIRSGFYIGTGSYQEVYEENIEGLKTLRSNDLSFPLSIQKGENRLVVSSNHKSLDPAKYFDYTNTSGVLEFKNMDKLEPGINENIAVILYLEDPSDLDIEIGRLSGIMDIYTSIRSLKIGDLSGVLNSSTESSYDIDIQKASGIVTFDFGQIDAKVKIGDASGIVDIEDMDASIFDSNTNYEKTYESGKNNINIQDASGVITISGDGDF